MPWYTVTKTIKGRKYLYLQMTYREGRKVRTKNKYLGPVNGGGFGSYEGTAKLPTAQKGNTHKGPSGGLKVDKIRRLKPMTPAQVRQRWFTDQIEARRRAMKEARKYGEVEEAVALRSENTETRRFYKSIYKKRLKMPK